MTSTSSLPSSPTSRDRCLAVRMKFMYCHDDTENQYDKLLTSNHTLTLFEGENGVLIRESPDGQWGVVQFQRYGKSFDVFVPKSYLVLGAEYLPFSEQVDRLGEHKRLIDAAPLKLNASGLLPSYPTIIEQYIRTLWVALRENADLLQTLGLEQSTIAEMFGDDKFSNNIDNIITAFTPDAQALMKSEGFSVRDVNGLPKVTSTWPGLTNTIYIRVYTHQDSLHEDEADAAVYAGMSTNAWYRDICHGKKHADHASGTDWGIHYRTARASPESCRRMMPVMIQTCDWNRVQTAMAEQTAIFLLNTYSPQILSTSIGPGTPDGKRWNCFASSIAQAKFLQHINQTVQTQVGWKPPAMRGCNVRSPLFGQGQVGAKQIQKTSMREPDPRGRHRTIYRIAARWSPTSMGGTPRLLWWLRLCARDNETGERYKPRIWTFKLNRTICGKVGIPFETFNSFVRFEIMDDGHPHPKAYIGVPGVGPYSNMEQASSLAIFVEWFSPANEVWYSMPLQHGHLPGMQVSRQPNPEHTFLIPYKKCMDIIQMLQGTLYEFEESAKPEDSIFRSIISHDQITEYTMDHLTQKIHLKQYTTPNVRMPAPKKQTYEENWQLMLRLFNKTGTVVGLRSDPATQPEFFFVQPTDDRRVTIHMPKSKADVACDACVLLKMRVNGPIADLCIPVPGRESTCGFCSSLGRPCTYTPRHLLLEYFEGSSPHPTRPGKDASPTPNGPYRPLLYHNTMSASETTEPVVIEKPFGADELADLLAYTETEEDLAEGEDGDENGDQDVDEDEDEDEGV